MFFYAILFMLGNGLALAYHPSYLIPITICCISWYKKALWGILVTCLGFGWAWYRYELPFIHPDGIQGRGIFKVESVGYSHSPFQKSILFRGILKEFKTTKGETWKKTPCFIYFSEKKIPPQANCHFLVQGRLVPKKNHLYVLKPTTALASIERTYSLAQTRFNLKQKIYTSLKEKISGETTCAFLFSLLTGEIDDRLLAMEFNRIGLLHLMGISGFQFTLLSLLLSLPLKAFFKHRIAYSILIILLSTYAFGLGDSPPVERAWVSSTLYLIALMAGYRTTSINILGCALLWILIKEPLTIFHLGFQFSFLCTAAILLLYPYLKKILLSRFSTYTFDKALTMSLIEQHGLLLSGFLKESVALNISIHIVTLPLILYHFCTFPLLSIIYNLFLPAGVSVIYVLLLVAIILIPPLDQILYKIVAWLTQLTLHVATHPPALYDFQWRTPHCSLTLTTLTLTVLFISSILLHKVDGIFQGPFSDRRTPV